MLNVVELKRCPGGRESLVSQNRIEEVRFQCTLRFWRLREEMKYNHNKNNVPNSMLNIKYKSTEKHLRKYNERDEIDFYPW